MSRPLDEQPDNQQGYDGAKSGEGDNMPWGKRQNMTPQQGVVVILDLVTTKVIKFENFGQPAEFPFKLGDFPCLIIGVSQ